MQKSEKIQEGKKIATKAKQSFGGIIISLTQKNMKIHRLENLEIQISGNHEIQKKVKSNNTEIRKKNPGRREDRDKGKAKFWRYYRQPCMEESENPQIRKSGNPEIRKSGKA